MKMILLLCFMLMGWSAEAAPMQQGVATRRGDLSTDEPQNMAADEDTADKSDNEGEEEEDKSDDDDDNKDNDEDDNNDDDDEDDSQAPAHGSPQKSVPVALSQINEVDATRPTIANVLSSKQALPQIVKHTKHAKHPKHARPQIAKEADSSTHLVVQKAPPQKANVVDSSTPKMAKMALPQITTETLSTTLTITNASLTPSELANNELLVAEEALAQNKQKQTQLKQRLDHLSDTSESSQEIDAFGKLVANETDSAAMAGILAEMWKEMRMFEVPFYAEHVQEELHRLKRDQGSLEAKLTAARENLAKEATKEANETQQGAEEEKKGGGNSSEQLTDITQGQINQADPNDANFWEMNSKQQENYLMGSFVYFVGGICLAFLHNKARKKEDFAKHFAAVPQPDVTRGSNWFSFSIVGCFNLQHLNICLMGCFCPCLRWADTMDRTGFLSYWKAFFAFFALTVLYGFTWGIAPILVVVLGVFYRQKLRNGYNLENGTARTVACDILAWIFCQPCAIIQEAREESVLQGSLDP